MPVITVAATDLAVVPPEVSGLSQTKLSQVEKLIEAQIAEQRMAGAVVVAAHNGKVGFFRTFGHMDIEAGRKMQADTIFRLRSMTKPIATAAALQLVEENKLRLDDPVSKHIPAFAEVQVVGAEGLRKPTRAMTVRDLMRHTSGMTAGHVGPQAHKEAYARANPRDSTDLVQLCEKLARVPLAADPGAAFMYPISTDVLGRVIEVVAGQPLDVVLQKRILDPLGMKDTGFRVPPEKLHRLAPVYQRSKEGLQRADQPDPRYLSAGSGLFGTASDYMRFLLMLHNGGKYEGRRLLRPETVRLMTTDQVPPHAYPINFPGPGGQVMDGTGFSLAFYVRTEVTNKWDPDAHIGEYGWAGSANTFFWVSPADKLIVLTMQQSIPFEWDFRVKKLFYKAIKK